MFNHRDTAAFASGSRDDALRTDIRAGAKMKLDKTDRNDLDTTAEPNSAQLDYTLPVATAHVAPSVPAADPDADDGAGDAQPLTVPDRHDRTVEVFETASGREPDLHFLDPVIVPAPPFPTEALPGAVRRFVDTELAGQKTCAPYLVTSLIATLAGAVGTAAHLWVTGDWCEPCVIWGVMVGRSGTGKTAALNKTVHVLTSLGIAATRATAPSPGQRALTQVIEAEIRRRTLRAIRAGLDRDETDFSAYAARFETAAKPEQITCTSITLNGILDRVQSQPRGLLLAQADIAGLVCGATLKTDEGRAALLQAFDADPYIRDRATGSVVIPTLQLSLCGGVVPGKLQDLIGREDDGFFSRALVSYPHVVRSPGLDGRGDATTSALAPVLRHILAQPGASDRFGGYRVLLSEHARRAVEAASRRWARIADEDESMLASTYNRAVTQALRLGLVLGIFEHVLEGRPGLPQYLSEACARSAITLLDVHYLPSAERALDRVQARPDPDKDLRAIARFIAANAEDLSFNARTLREARRAPCGRDHAAWSQALDRLLRLGCIAEAQRRNTIGRGRSDYRLHPAFAAAAREVR